jgi:uncharacterized repeat protein (TIGR03803 family)
VLYDFSGGGDGSGPRAGLIFDGSGNLYGTTEFGGEHSSGTVFQVTPSGTETVLYSFCSLAKCTDGYGPVAGLTFDQSGNLYGTTFKGGASNQGTVFKLTPNGGSWKESVLHNFTGGNDGSEPVAGLIFDTAGSLYSTTYLGGANRSGVAFRLTLNTNGSWKETVLRSFTGSKGGANPVAGLIFDQAGNLYGTTVSGGPHGRGVAFRLTPTAQGAWHETVLIYFNNHPGSAPCGSLILDAAGKLYGTTFGHGVASHGSVFELAP